MALLHTPAKKTGFTAPSFTLNGVDGNTYRRDDICGENGTLIMFICNHCPYVIAVIERIVTTAQILQKNGIGCAAIMSNDVQSYPADSFENMKKFAQKYNMPFPYLYDETQNTAKEYEAVCTPDFFGFDKNNILQYRGRLDSAANKPADENTIPELLNAFMDIKDGKEPQSTQHASMGCSIKWKR